MFRGHPIKSREEDYLEAILRITEEDMYARTTKVAKALDVSAPSVTEMFRKLDAKGLLRYERSKGVRLTERGRRIAESVWDRHVSLKRFLMLFDLPEETCDRDACALEHDLSPETIIRIKEFMSFAEEREPPLGDEMREFLSSRQ